MPEDCDYCDEDFSSERDKLQHELDEHGEEMNSHEESEKKSRLNKLEEKSRESKRKRKNQLKYGAVAAALLVVVAAGGYKVYQSAGSFSPEKNATIGLGESIHWHAPYTIKVCGERKVLSGGPVLAHTHGETTFHLEGVRSSREQATLGWIMEQLGAPFSTDPDSIMGKKQCNGEPANLTVKVNGKKVDDPEDYIVRDGDNIKVVFE